MRRSKLFYAMRFVGMLRIWAKKEGHRNNQGPIGVKVKNLQRGTAAAVELGGKATMCISYVRYDANLCSAQCFFVHGSYAFAASAEKGQKKGPPVTTRAL
ncbi:hypothetical protein QA648_09910 [Rhizobium sp. CB3171]|uniref:hypothetical protein n=1 Tax=Rhizobium sp. CB3171 TaxID=3039157 RepID=UPI0024B091D8|nr:hypothetical protein [Rhizobium sp. CB3171]WFU00495.1 hypothetical protein QA648_09910 [Rhizobium sp. CB3171]